MTEIRTATKNDAALIAAMSRETFFDTFVDHNTKEDMDKFLAEQFSTESLQQQVGAEGNSFFIAYENDQPAGYLFLKDQHHTSIPDENTIEISRLYARKSFIGKGIGKALMQKAVAYALSENKNFLWLGVWEHNQRAIDFYTSFGFEKIGEQDFVLGNDVQRDWVMKLKINS